MNLYRVAACILLLACSKLAFAEGNCPPGYFPIGGGNAGWNGCAPTYDPSMPASATPPNPPDPGPRWEFRWGVIVVDGERGKFAGIDGYADPRKATRDAMRQCKKNGGKKCEILIEYYNQCGVLVAGDAHTVAFHGPLVEEARKRAMADCSAHTNNCQVYYAGCSYPVEKEY